MHLETTATARLDRVSLSDEIHRVENEFETELHHLLRIGVSAQFFLPVS